MRPVCARLPLLVLLSGWLVWSGAQEFTLRYLELRDLYHTPAEIILSPNYQTTLEFDGLPVERVSTGRADQITAEVAGSTIRLRANANVVATDLTVVAGGRTALFALRADLTTDAPRHYLIRERPVQPTGAAASTVPARATGGSMSGGATVAPSPKLSPTTDLAGSARSATSVSGTSFQASAYSNGGEVVVQYVLSNTGDETLHVDPQRLRLRQGDAELPFTLYQAPERGSVRLAAGASEYGTLVLNRLPQGDGQIELRWGLSRLGSSEFGTLERILELPPQAEAGAQP